MVEICLPSAPTFFYLWGSICVIINIILCYIFYLCGELHDYTVNINNQHESKKRTCCARPVLCKTATVLKGQGLGGSQGSLVFLKNWSRLLSLQPASESREEFVSFTIKQPSCECICTNAISWLYSPVLVSIAVVCFFVCLSIYIHQNERSWG